MLAYILFLLVIFNLINTTPSDFRSGVDDFSVTLTSTIPAMAKDPIEVMWEAALNDQLSICQEQEAYFLYSLGCFYKDNISAEETSELFSKLASLDLFSEYTSGLMMKYYFSKEQLDKIVQLPLITQNKLDDDTNSETLLMAACALDSSGQCLEANNLFVKLEKNYFESEQVAYQIILRLMKKGLLKEALDKVNKFLSLNNIRSKHGQFFLLKAYLQDSLAYNSSLVLRTIDEGLVINPRHDGLLRLKLTVLMKLNQKINAEIVQILQLLANLTNEISYRKTLASIFYKAKLYKKALKEVLAISDNSYQHVLMKITLYSKLFQHEKALNVLDEYLKYNEQSTEMFELRAQLLYKSERYEDLLDVLLAQFKRVPSNENLLVKILFLGTKILKQEKLILSLTEVVESTNNIYCKVALADFCLMNNFFGYASDKYGKLKQEVICKTNALLNIKLLFSEAKIESTVGDKKLAEFLIQYVCRVNPVLQAGWVLAAKHSMKSGDYSLATFFIYQALFLYPLDECAINLKKDILEQVMQHSKFVLRKAITSQIPLESY